MRFRYIVAVLFLFLLSTAGVFAQEKSFSNDYTVQYFLTEDQDKLSTKVQFTIATTNFKTTEYVGTIGLTFPQSFSISNVKASDDKGEVKPEIVTSAGKTQIKLSFNDPNVGKNTKNTFNLEFTQANVFNIFGNTWEMIVPTVDDTARSSYIIAVHLPASITKKMSIAKPAPTKVDGNTIYWDNPSTRTIYAIFGEQQYYDLKLTYHLRNPKLIPVYEEIAFPPDTLYQKTYVTSINPPPYSVRIDDDGNYIARYNLQPKQSINVVYDGHAEVVATARSEAQKYAKNVFPKQQKYLLTPKDYWNIDDESKIPPGKNVSDIYYFVSKTLKYDYDKLKTSVKRLGAQEALIRPTEAICMEFADTFVAIAREKGIYSREIEGYGFSQDSQLRPLSASSDVLHAWPEYYDPATQVWKAVDPTWENTSGIDYFSSFDLSHIVFAIHGQDPDIPYPAGSYKWEQSKDVSVKPSDVKPTERIRISLEPVNIPKTINDKNTYHTKVVVKNNSNIYLWDVPVKFEGTNIRFNTESVNIPILAPYEKKEIVLTYNTSLKNKRGTGTFNVYVMNDKIYTSNFSIIPYYFSLALKIVYGILGFSIFFIVIMGIRKFRTS